MSSLIGMGPMDGLFFTNVSVWNRNDGNASTTNDSGLTGILNDDLLWTNYSALNETYPGAGAKGGYVIDAVGYFLVILTLILVVLCWASNCVVIKALNQMGDDKMKFKFLIKNAILGDILLSLSIGLRSIFAMTGLLANENAGILARCINVIYGSYGYFAVFYQIFTSMSVACDRFYSILKPLKYHSMRYSRSAKIIIVVVILAVVTSLSVPVALVKLQPGKPLITICYAAYNRSFYSTSVLPYMILFTVFFTLLIYCGVLCLIAYHRRVNRGTIANRNENQDVRRRQTSLAITFFLIHIAYIIMYMPGPIYFTFRPASLYLQPNLNYYITQITLIIYLLNAVLDPLIYIFRIPSIRANVRRMFAREQKRYLSTNPSSQKTTI